MLDPLHNAETGDDWGEIREIYRQTRCNFDKVMSGKEHYAFKILYAPPSKRPPILFVGYQPGGGEDDYKREMARGTDKHWPAECEYAHENWPLARLMRDMFGRTCLERCQGINAIFVRWPSQAGYARAFDAETLNQIEKFCLARVIRVIEVINPQKIVAIGFKALKLFGTNCADDLQNERGRTLTRIGTVAGRPAIGVLHLSGARISTPDLARIRGRVLAFRGSCRRADACGEERSAGTMGAPKKRL